MSDSKIHEFIHGTASLDGGMVSRTRCKCWQCGKPFYKTPQHAYKLSMKAKGKADGYVYFCSYSCMRVTQRALDEEKRRRDEEIDQIRQIVLQRDDDALLRYGGHDGRNAQAYAS